MPLPRENPSPVGLATGEVAVHFNAGTLTIVPAGRSHAMTDRIMGVYTIRNTITGAVYVGSSSNIKHRWRTHRQALQSGRSVNRGLQDDWDAHGAEAFVFAVVEEIPATNDYQPLIAAELRWIDQFAEAGIVVYNRAAPCPPRPFSQIEGRTLLGVKDAARRLGIHPHTLRSWADEGRIACERTLTGHRRFAPAEIDRVIERGNPSCS